MDRTLDSLATDFKPLAFAFLARLVEARIPVVIVNTRRTAAEQAEALATGHSWVPRSKHQDGLAMDVCPLLTFQLHGYNKLQWDTTDLAWATIGRLAEGLGLRWGGRWTPPDPGHVELWKGTVAT